MGGVPAVKTYHTRLGKPSAVPLILCKNWISSNRRWSHQLPGHRSLCIGTFIPALRPSLGLRARRSLRWSHRDLTVRRRISCWNCRVGNRFDPRCWIGRNSSHPGVQLFSARSKNAQTLSAIRTEAGHSCPGFGIRNRNLYPVRGRRSWRWPWIWACHCSTRTWHGALRTRSPPRKRPVCQNLIERTRQASDAEAEKYLSRMLRHLIIYCSIDVICPDVGGCAYDRVAGGRFGVPGCRGMGRSSSNRMRSAAPSRSSYWPLRNAHMKAASPISPSASAIGTR